MSCPPSRSPSIRAVVPMNGWSGHGHLASPIPLTVRTAREHPDEWAEHDQLGARRPRQCASSGDDSPISPRHLDDDNANRPIGNGLLLSPDGRVVRHVDSFVRSTRHRGRGEQADEPIDICEWSTLCFPVPAVACVSGAAVCASCAGRAGRATNG